MPELKGLLDAARGRIRGLLGDFPQGFAAGSVAGVAGYPGDIAYMLDTAGRAITGQHTQPAAQDFPGTTDYIANKAGYPIPPSFSGQLGAAVGGMLTPGPGDLARFAPVLAAIPFWHGSPHKYDAVDLSKIGTGEGAQAYGHGYYGADSAQTAIEYRDKLSQDTKYKGTPTQDLPMAGESNEAAAIRSVTGDVALGVDPAEAISKQAAEWRASANRYREYAKGMPAEKAAIAEQRAQGFEEIAATVERFNPDDFYKNAGYLYKGEYRWPDPAKEATTPLTGEDLLDWDKPLSEQSDSVKAVLRRSPLAPDESVWPQWTGQQLYESEVRAGTDFDGIAKGDARANLSEHLRQAGIPGIRYLDQMSRGAGEGTRNYVMFDDKGIKLLERNGEPIKAAEDFAARRAGKAKPYKEAMGVGNGL